MRCFICAVDNFVETDVCKLRLDTQSLSSLQHLVEVNTGDDNDDDDGVSCAGMDTRSPPSLAGATLPTRPEAAQFNGGGDRDGIGCGYGDAGGSGVNSGSSDSSSLRSSGSGGCCCCRSRRNPLSAAIPQNRASGADECGKLDRRSDHGEETSEGPAPPAQEACGEGGGRSCRCVVTYEGEITGLASQVRRAGPAESIAIARRWRGRSLR